MYDLGTIIFFFFFFFYFLFFKIIIIKCTLNEFKVRVFLRCSGWIVAENVEAIHTMYEFASYFEDFSSASIPSDSYKMYGQKVVTFLNCKMFCSSNVKLNYRSEIREYAAVYL